MILRPGEKIVCDTGVMALMDDTVLTGPGKVCLQTMTVANLATSGDFPRASFLFLLINNMN